MTGVDEQVPSRSQFLSDYRKPIRELEQIRAIGHLLQKAGEADARVRMPGRALECAGRKIIDSASEIMEAFAEAKEIELTVRPASKRT